MLEIRKRFHDELSALEREVAAEGDKAERAVGRSIDAVVRKDVVLADEVIAEDDAIDAQYLDVERRIIDLLAMQTPVAGDLRLVSAIMHINLHLERVGDMAVNIAKIAKATRDLPPMRPFSRTSRRWRTSAGPCFAPLWTPSSGGTSSCA